MNTGKVFLSLFLLFLYICYSNHHVYADTPVYINGIVLDATTSQPIKNAIIELGNVPTKLGEWQQVENRTTDNNGVFSYRVKAGNSYGVLVSHNGSNTPGFDYAPIFMTVTANENITLSINLHPSMSIIFTGDLLFVETTKPSDYYSYKILGTNLDEEYIQNYGTTPPCYNFLGLPANYIIVPVDQSFTVNLSARVMPEKGGLLFHNFIMDFGKYTLVQGTLIEINVQRFSTRHNLNLISEFLISSEQRLIEIEEKGFFVADEKQKLARAENLFALAEAKLNNESYDESYVDIRESYLNIAETDKRIGEIYSEASGSTLILTVFINLTAVALAFFLFERPKLKYVFSIIFLAILFTALYLVYPGCRLISTRTLLWNALISLGISICVITALPYIIGEVTVSIFSLAKINLKKRKLRFFLTFTSVMMMVLSFISLTSFSTGYGLVMKTSLTLIPTPSGLLLKQPISSKSNILNFLPIDPSIVYAIQNKPDVLIVAPKMESAPMPQNIGYMSSLKRSRNTLPLSGILGILPSAEINVSSLERMIKQGRYLDDGENAVLISAHAASLLEIKLDDNIILSTIGSEVNVTVVGFLDDFKLSTAKDVNGESILPSKFVINSETGIHYLETCSPEEIVIVTLNLASKIFGMSISRINIVLKDWGSALSFSRQIALERGLVAYYSSENKIHQTVVGSYIETKGISIFVPWFIVILSVVTTVLNAIHEQKREIAILSSIGLNPSHIGGLFVAEASIIGLVGGNFGYLLGLGNYKLMSTLSIVPEVQAKVSAVWCLAAILVSMATVIVGAIVALRSSVIITPSLIRRWYMDDQPHEAKTYFSTLLPIKIREEDLDSMFEFIIKRVKTHLLSEGADLKTGGIRRFREHVDGRDIVRIKFHYVLGQQFTVGRLPFELVAKRIDGKTYELELLCKDDEENFRKTTTFIRLALIEWSSLNR